MNKLPLALSVSAAALLAGCRVYLPGEMPRRTVFVSSNATVQTAAAQPADASSADARRPAATPDYSTPSSERIAPQPVSAPVPMQVTEPTPVVGVVTGVLLPAGSPTPNAAAVQAAASAAALSAPAGTPASAAPAAPPAPALPQTAGPDSYLNYMGKGKSPASSAPSASAARAPRAAAPAAPQAAGVAAADGYRIYTVKAGDSAGAIANANGMKLADFAKLNDLSDPNKLRVGQTVKIATARPAAAAAPAQPAAAAPVRATPARTSGAQASQEAVHPIPTPTTRPPAATPAAPRVPARVTADEASAAPGGTVRAGDATFDVDAALSGGGLGAARQRAQETAQTAQSAAQETAQRAQSAAQETAQAARTAAQETAQAAQSAAQQVRSAVSTGTKEYIVQEDDDIYSIAMKFDSQPLKIRALNGGVTLDDIKPGDRILVPAN